MLALEEKRAKKEELHPTKQKAGNLAILTPLFLQTRSGSKRNHNEIAGQSESCNCLYEMTLSHFIVFLTEETKHFFFFGFPSTKGK